MPSVDMGVTCPRCGASITARRDSHAIDDRRLKGSTTSCRRCDNTVELYYY